MLYFLASSNLNFAIDKLRRSPELASKDPSTVLTIAMLYHLLKVDVGVAEDRDRENREVLRRRFEEMNWPRIGESGMQALDIGDPET